VSISKRKWLWLEEFKCGCTNVIKTKREALGYCPVHGQDRRRIILIRKKLGNGYAG